MSEYEMIKYKIKNKNNNVNIGNEKNIIKYVNNLITRSLLSLILFLFILIITSKNANISNIIKKNIFENNINISKFTKIYNTYFGGIAPIKNQGADAVVFNEKIIYKNIENYENGFKLSVTDNYLIPVIKSGVVVFIGEKEKYGNVVIIQGIDEIDYWYGSVTNLSVKLYDYVTEATLLGNTINDNLYLVFQRQDEFLDYEEVLS